MQGVAILLMAVSHLLAARSTERCSVGELRQSPEYQYRAERIADFVDSAEVVVRVLASDSTEVEEWRGHTSPAVRFLILEKLRGAAADSMIVLPERFVDRDDFNPLPVPYQMVRPSGQQGSCFTRDYRRNREYLLLLRTVRGRLTNEWRPLAPFNEQVQGPNDEWVRWVRAQVHAGRGGAGGRVLSQTAEPAPYIALRLVVPHYMPGAELTPHVDSLIFLAPRPFLSDRDLLRVTTHRAAGEALTIRAHCRAEACERLAGLTSSNIGRSLALLIDSRVRDVVPIMSSIGAGGSLTIQTGARGADADRIVQEIHKRWPPH